jgi:signal transduction histidine kinase
LVPVLTDEMFVAAAKDEEHLQLLRSLGASSLMIVPMTARGRTFGAITMMRGPGSAHFGPDDLRLGEELARRAALAVDNAQLYRAAVAANEVKGNFLATMSHELRTPLTAIIGYEELLADGITGPVTDAQVQQLGRIKASANHLLELIDEILLFARLEAGREVSSPTVVLLHDVVENARGVIAPSAAAKGVELRVDVTHAPVTLRTDSRKVHQILLNLLANAVKFTERGSVTLRASVEDNDLVVEVTDTGIGIPSEHLTHIFDAFWQVEQRATRAFGGSGLGLSVSQHLARLLGGEVTVRSEVGVGSTFTLRVPNATAAGRA